MIGPIVFIHKILMKSKLNMDRKNINGLSKLIFQPSHYNILLIKFLLVNNYIMRISNSRCDINLFKLHNLVITH